MTPQPPDSLPQIPELESDFELVRELGRGGTAVVYLARDRDLGRDVAIKLIRPSYLQDEDAIARLEREARTVGKLQHPNIVLLLGTRRLGEKGLALILQFVPGRTLKERIREKGPLPIREAEQVLRDVGQALAYAHRRRIVHRDIKPENVYLDEDAGLARLADFGIARAWDSDSGLTLPGTAIGTPTYMSPEQVDGGDLDGRSDIYSLGLLGYEMLTGTQPWEGESLYNVIYKQKHEPLPPLEEARPDIPPHLLEAVDVALRKDRAERWANAEAFLEALDADSEEGTAHPSAGAPGTPDFFSWQAPDSSPIAPPTDPASKQRSELPGWLRRRREERKSGAAGGDGSDEASRRGPPSPQRGPSPGAPHPSPASPPPGEPHSAGSPPGGAHPGAPPRAGPPPHGAQPGAPQPDSPYPSGPWLDDPEPDEPRRWPRTAGWAAALVVLLGVGIAGLATAGDPDSELGAFLGQIFAGTDDPAGPPADAELERPGSFDTWATDPGDPGAPTDAGATDPDLALPDPATEPDAAEETGPVPPGAALTLVQGDEQSGAPGVPLPQTIVFQVEDPDGEPIAGAAVQLEVTAGGGTVQPNRPISDASGFVAFQWSLGTDTGTQSVEATLEGAEDLIRTLTAEAVARVPAELEVVAGSGQEAEAGATLGNPVRIRVVDPQGRAVPGTTVLFEVAEGAVASGSVTTGNTGEAATQWTLGPDAGVQTLVARVPDADLETTIQAEAVPATLAVRPALLAGGTFSCALGGDGQVRCWGSNSQGQLGDGSGTRRTAPGPAAGSFSRLAVGISHACALDDVGTPYCWGSNSAGQLGDGSTTTRTQPTPVADAPSMVEITAGASHTCGVARGGGIWCWGDNASGQLGDGSTTRRTTPVRAGGGAGLRQVTAGWQHTCALTGGGQAVCWGDNREGQLGRSSPATSGTPSQVDVNLPFTHLAAGSRHTCGRTSAGDVLCWGSNQYGQLGDGSTQGRWEPEAIDSGTSFQNVAVGAQHSCAIAGTGGAYCWGRNLYGQLGDGSTNDRASPVPVEGSLRFSQLHALGSHTCGRSPAGDLICWGYNSDGQLGDGSRTNRPTPVQVGPPGS